MKIDIIGSVGSGKTTLAKKLSQIYHMPCYEKDEIVWVRDEAGDYKRNDEERDSLFQSILDQEDWIVEGSPRKVLQESMEEAELIIFLDPPSMTRLKRIIYRWLRQRSGKEAYKFYPSLKALRQYIKWHCQFNRDKKKILDSLSIHSSKLIICRTSKEAEEVIQKRFT